MASITYYVAIPFGRSEDGDLVAGEPKECQSEAAARSAASRLALINAGAIAFSRTGDPTTGDFEPAKIVARYGETPEYVE